MQLRDALNKNPLIVVGAVVALIACAGYLAFRSLKTEEARAPTQAYFTIDEGKTRFLDDRNLIPPFTHDGKEAVRVAVFACAGDRTEFDGYLEKFTPEYKANREAGTKQQADTKAKLPAGPPSQAGAAAGPPPGGPPALGTLLKKIGGTEWVPMTSPEGIKIQQSVVCPKVDDHQAAPERVDP